MKVTWDHEGIVHGLKHSNPTVFEKLKQTEENKTNCTASYCVHAFTQDALTENCYVPDT